MPRNVKQRDWPGRKLKPRNVKEKRLRKAAADKAEADKLAQIADAKKREARETGAGTRQEREKMKQKPARRDRELSPTNVKR